MNSAKPMVLAIVGACAFAPACSSSGTIFRAVPWQVAIPPFNVDSVTRDSASIGAYALVGTVVDSISGKPLESAQILLRVPGGGRTFRAITDSRGDYLVTGRGLPTAP